jgi:hypothetical protein
MPADLKGYDREFIHESAFLKCHAGTSLEVHREIGAFDVHHPALNLPDSLSRK